MVVALCLNMIVKNESKIIMRLLQSVLPIIDNYIICDTGSTDNTPQIITDFFNQHNIPGEVIYEPFKNFGYNRSYAFTYAQQYYIKLQTQTQQNNSNTNEMYALLLDADMILKIEPSFNKQLLTEGAYLLTQTQSSLSYYNVRLINLNVKAKCLGPTHEYYDYPKGTTSQKLNSLWISDIGDGGSKENKYNRDIQLLTQGIEDEPNNERYYFYLANSYFNSGRHRESIPHYIKRIAMGGWNEEVFYSHLNLGHAYKTNNQIEHAISTWLNGYNSHTSRSETIYEITKYYRETSKHTIAQMFCMIGKNIPLPVNDVLFIHNDVYNTGFDYELSIIGYYTKYPNLHKLTCSLMNRIPDKYENLLSNYKFCYPKLSHFLIKQIGNQPITETIQLNIFDKPTSHIIYGSSPSLFKIKADTLSGYKYMLNIRYVNYKLLENGIYQIANEDGGNIITVNKIYELDADMNWNTSTPTILLPSLPYEQSQINTNTDTNTYKQNQYIGVIGIEDLKPYYNYNSLCNPQSIIAFTGTIQHPLTQKRTIGYGEINLNMPLMNTSSNELYKTVNYSVVENDFNASCEKNWVFYGDYNIIYKWYPLTIGKIIKKPRTDTNTNTIVGNDLFLHIEKTIVMPPYFTHVRGSTNGFEYNNEIWFICHIVDYGTPRIYYHLFVVFNKIDMTLIKWSHLFKFDDAKIEFTLGLIVEETRIIISYSKWDSCPTIGIYNKENIEKELF